MYADNKSKKKKRPKKKGTTAQPAPEQQPTTPMASTTEHDPGTADPSEESEFDESDVKATTYSTNTSVEEEAVGRLTNGVRIAGISEDDPAQRFDALVKDRDALRAEVTQLRQSLEELQLKHEDALSDVQSQLQETVGEKEEAQEQYQSLLGKVNTIKAQLGERLKSDAVGIYSLGPHP
jgi:vacuolar-type H+-ATPase subunit I/STV1